MLPYLFFDSLLSTCPKRMEIEKWPKVADSPLHYILSFCMENLLVNIFTFLLRDNLLIN